ncbi:MAG: permease prefix domain 1-containing protein [Clostridium sp.]|uniref:permease prefix domain 1-containing protein n=1 Tax=Clostridium sp. TaxID=1506 RepID=UPI002905F7C3|nr:permease prefix domain 1-containing protein [Clostridium sp.]MDU7252096.1 permease prefix domain 1-containing protein [Clostridium sp.]
MNNEITSFCEEVCKYVSFKESHESLKEEVSLHINEKIDFYMCEGYSKNDALNKAIIDMGDPREIGIQFNKVYKGLVPWNILIGILGLSIIGLLIIFNLGKSIYINGGALGLKHIVSLCLGIGIIYIMYNINYTIIFKQNNLFYIIGIIIAILGMQYGISINNSIFLKIGYISFEIDPYINIVFILSLVCSVIKINNYTKKDLIKIIITSILSLCIVYTICSIENFIIMLIVYLFIMILTLNDYHKINQTLKKALLIINCIFLNAYLIIKLLNIKIHNSIINTNSLWDYESALIIEKYGIQMIVILLILFTVILIGMTINTYKLKNMKEYYLTMTIIIYMLAKFILGIIGGLNMLGPIKSPIPFVSYGTSNYILDCLLIGIFLSIWRRRLITHN